MQTKFDHMYGQRWNGLGETGNGSGNTVNTSKHKNVLRIMNNEVKMCQKWKKHGVKINKTWASWDESTKILR